MMRAVPMDERQYLLLENLGHELLRERDSERGLALLALALLWHSAPEIPEPRTARSQIDDSAALAEVIELHGYSRHVDKIGGTA